MVAGDNLRTASARKRTAAVAATSSETKGHCARIVISDFFLVRGDQSVNERFNRGRVPHRRQAQPGTINLMIVFALQDPQVGGNRAGRLLLCQVFQTNVAEVFVRILQRRRHQPLDRFATGDVSQRFGQNLLVFQSLGVIQSPDDRWNSIWVANRQ